MGSDAVNMWLTYHFQSQRASSEDQTNQLKDETVLGEDAILPSFRIEKLYYPSSPHFSVISGRALVPVVQVNSLNSSPIFIKFNFVLMTVLIYMYLWYTRCYFLNRVIYIPWNTYYLI